MFKRNKVVFKEVNYRFLYKNTLSFILLRRVNKLNFKNYLCDIKLLFWYKHIPTDEFNLFRLYNNIMLIWLLFKQKCIFRKIGTSFRLNVYYSRVMLLTNVGKKNIYRFLDLVINGFLPNVRLVSIKFFFVNDNLIINISDLTFFTSIKVGRFFYVENVTDNLLFEFKHNLFKITNYLTLFKLNGV